jgi:curli biogenesis system outer membrane secretion channel CsgG
MSKEANVTRKSLLMMSLLACMMFTACAPTAEVITKGGPTIEKAQAEPATGGKMRIAVMTFENESRYDVGNGMRSMLTSALFETDKFIIVEREMLQDVLLEQKLGATGVVKADTAAPVGEVEGAQLLIYGKVTDFEPGQRGFGAGYGNGTQKADISARQSHVAIDIRIVDARTSRVVATTTVEGKATDVSLGADVLRYLQADSPLAIGLSVWNNTPVGSAIRLCIDRAVDYIIKNMK